MEIHNTKTKDSDSNPDADSSLDDMVKEITGRKEADLKQREEAEQERKKEAEKQQRKMSEYSDSD